MSSPLSPFLPAVRVYLRTRLALSEDESNRHAREFLRLFEGTKSGAPSRSEIKSSLEQFAQEVCEHPLSPDGAARAAAPFELAWAECLVAEACAEIARDPELRDNPGSLRILKMLEEEPPPSANSSHTELALELKLPEEIVKTRVHYLQARVSRSLRRRLSDVGDAPASQVVWKDVREAERIRLGELAIARGILRPEEVEEALEEQARHGGRRRLGHVLIERGKLSTAECSRLLLEQEELAGEVFHERLGRFLLLNELGRGGMGVVWRAWDPHLGRSVALKGLNVSRSQSPAHLLREARAAAQLSHPNIVPIHEIVEQESMPCLVMGLVEGKTLAQGASDLPLRRVLELARDVARALHYAHRLGVVHRDIKPENLMIDREGKVWVTDFGLAKLERSGGEVSQSGVVLGTPIFMSPEQTLGRTRRVGPKSDVYSLGATLYTLIAGHPPFGGATPAELMVKVIDETPAALRSVRSDVPVDVETIVSKAMEKSPERRYATAAAMADDLDRHLRGERILARPVPAVVRLWDRIRRHGVLVALGSVASIAVAALAFSLTREKGRAPLGSQEDHLVRAEAKIEEALSVGLENPEAYGAHLAEARRDADFALAQHPTSGKAHFLRAIVAKWEGNDVEARRHFSRALECEPLEVLYRFHWAWYRLERFIWELEVVELGEPGDRFARRTREIAADLERVVGGAPASSGLREWARAALAAARGDFAETDRVARQARPTRELHRLRAFALIQRGQPAEAKLEVGNAARLKPGDPYTIVLSSLLLAHLGHVKESPSEIDKASRLLRRDPKVYLLRAKFAHMAEDFEKAKADCRVALEQGPEDPETLYWFASLEIRTKWESGMKMYGDAIEASRRTGRLWTQGKSLMDRAVYYALAKKYSEALSDFEAAEILDPANPAVPKNRARTHFDRGDRIEISRKPRSFSPNSWRFLPGTRRPTGLEASVGWRSSVGRRGWTMSSAGSIR